MEINKILYTTDLSPNSEYAFGFTVDLAKKYDSKIVILHVFEELPGFTEEFLALFEMEESEKVANMSIQGRYDKIQDRIKAFYKKELKDEPESVKRILNVEVYVGYPAEEILKKADELACDIIVMGAHGKGVLEYTFLGSISKKVLRRSKKPVFIIPLPGSRTNISIDDV
ncbi:universal stress protein [Thermodesulfobacteriota bacterium]